MSANTQPIIVKKKKGGHAGHHGGSWKVAYADFVTAMMAFFMVMWIMGLSQDDRKAIASYFNDPVGFMKNPPRSREIMPLAKGGAGSAKAVDDKQNASAAREEQSMKRIEKQVVAKVEAEGQAAKQNGLEDLGKNVKVSVTPDGVQIEFVETRGAVFFESGSAVIRPEARRIVAGIAPLLARSGRAMVIEGHTDAAPCAAPGGNWGLSTARAMSLMEEMRTDGCRDDQFKQVVGYAATRLEKPNAPLDFSNRRVTILIPREAKSGEAPPAADLHDKIAEGSHPQAIDLKPPKVTIRRAP